MPHKELRPALLQRRNCPKKTKKEVCHSSQADRVTVVHATWESLGSTGSRGLREGGAEPFTMACSEGQASETEVCWVRTHSTGMTPAVESKPWGFTRELGI